MLLLFKKLVHSCSCCWVTKSCLTLCNPMDCSTEDPLSFTIKFFLLKFISILSVMLSNHLILCSPFLLLPSVFPRIRVFYNELALCIRWPQCWSFSISLSNEYSELISFRMDWLDLFVAQGTQGPTEPRDLQRPWHSPLTSMWNPSSLTMSRSAPLAVEAWSLNYRTTREVLCSLFYS